MNLRSRCFALILLPVHVVFSQAIQVTAANGYSVDPPVLATNGTSVFLAHGTNFNFYGFPAAGPAGPNASPVHPDPSNWSPTAVRLAASGPNVILPFIDFHPSRLRHELKYTRSTDGGSTWGPVIVHDSLTVSTSIMLEYDNLQIATADDGLPVILWRSQIDTSVKLSTGAPGAGGFGPAVRLEFGVSDRPATALSFDLVRVGGTYHLVLLFARDTTVYVTRSTNFGGSFSTPVAIDSIRGSFFGYYNRTSVVGNASGRMFAMVQYWAMGAHQPGQPPNDRSGTKLLTSTDLGASWSTVGLLDSSNAVNLDLSLTSGSTLVQTRIFADEGNLALATSRDGRSWSAWSRVNPVVGTALGYFDVGSATVLIDSATAGVAWVDTTTGNDEIFYRRMALPAAPVTGVETFDAAPRTAALHPNFPNPFNPETQIAWRTDKAGWVKVSIFDLIGREVAVLADGWSPAGEHRAVWRAAGHTSGVYICRLTTDASTLTRRMLLVR